MTTITREQLRERAREKVKSLEFAVTQTAFSENRAELEEELELARIALASLEAEPVGTFRKGPCGYSPSFHEDAMPLYAAPPAPVSVPDERAAFETFMEKRFKDCIDRRLVKNGDGEYFAWDMQVAWIAWQGHAAMLQAEPVSNSDELPLDYLQGHKDGLEWAAQLAEANHPQTGDWLYDDQIDLARAIRKGPDMPTVQGGNSPVIPDGWVMVPVELTPDMRAAWDSAPYTDDDDNDMQAAYRAMIAAAPQWKVK
ncbi:hypothetical protein ELY39_17635 [Escherichia coli]|uniref:hypothetical protein n=1 Tax=Escherichia coli TaxID=562 RepID=UPI0010740B20|nr:hypothetical protein [Escherichia coli]EHY5950746.1 hypothetical protein [Escherichia coli]TFL68025.1 hypothetical protein ELY39_17635 [Escherichia coli]